MLSRSVRLPLRPGHASKRWRGVDSISVAAPSRCFQSDARVPFGGYRSGDPVVQQASKNLFKMPREVGAANLDWEKLLFDYVPTRGHVRFTNKKGKWSMGSFHEEPYMTIHILANVFHYGQAVFEGCKAYQTKDGRVCVFYDDANWERLAHSCSRMHMDCPGKQMFHDAIDEALRQNIAYIPPYGTNGSMYIRPFVFGSGPKLGLGPSTEYTFCVFVNPVGNYYKPGTLQSLDGVVVDDYDRAAPLGAGDCKAAGNYAADLESMMKYKSLGYSIGLYLDARERRYIEEFNTSNFIAITKDGKYITPLAPRSVLGSCTNRVLSRLAEDMGMQVERRPIDFEAEVDNFAEVGAVGTAVVVTPISSLTRGSKIWKFGEPKVLKQLYDAVRAIQTGEAPDKHGFMREVDLDLATGAPGSLRSIYPPL